jgi:hypothetical protein
VKSTATKERRIEFGLGRAEQAETAETGLTAEPAETADLSYPGLSYPGLRASWALRLIRLRGPGSLCGVHDGVRQRDHAFTICGINVP